MKYRCECHYCGYSWAYEGNYAWQPPREGEIRCRNGNCNSLVMIREVHPESNDIFGYRFSPPFPEEKKTEYQYSRY